MRAAAALAWRLLRTGGRRDLTTVALSVTAFAVSSALLLLVLGGVQGFAGRADREAWREPAAVAEPDAARAVVASSLEPVDGRALTVVDVVALDPSVPVPGLPHAPNPGEVWLSPALAELVDELPPSRLADRLLTDRRVPGARPAGDVGPAGLLHDDELLAVVGRAVDDPLMQVGAEHLAGSASVMSPRPVTELDASGRAGLATLSSLYLLLAQAAAVLLVVPLLTLGGAASRLGVSRRDLRLATLRLLGGTRRQIVVASTVDAVVAGAAGALAGAALYATVLLPLATLIPFHGAAFSLGDLWLGVPALLAVTAGVIALAGLSAVLGLRRVVVSPLGVARRHTPARLRAVRLLVLVAAVVTWGVLGGGALAFGVGAVLALMAAVFGVLGVVGPWIIGMAGRIAARRARRPEQLLAARRLADDPKGAWRGVAGLALAGFVAATVSIAPALAAGPARDTSPQWQVMLPTGTDAAAAAGAVESALDAAGVAAHVSDGTGSPPTGAPAVRMTLDDPDPGAVDRARTALIGVLPGAVVRGEPDDNLAPVSLGPDVLTGGLLTLGIAFAVAAVSAGITQAAAILDRRRTLAQLVLAGTPVRVLRRARTREVLLPLVLTLGLSVGLGLFFLLPLVGPAVLADPTGVVALAVSLVVGTAGVLAATAGSTPLLRRVAADAVPEPD